MTKQLPSYDEFQKAAPANIVIERIGPDPFGRGWDTIFFRDTSVNVLEVFYCALHNWDYIPEDFQ